MTREFAPVQTRIWTNPDFTNLSVPAQLLYLTCLSHPTITFAGVIDYRPNRLAALSPTWDRDTIDQAARELEEQHFLIIDRDTEEAFIRSFHRNDGLMKQQNMSTSAARAIRQVASRHIHAWIAHELHRLKDEQPYIAGWKSDEMLQYLRDNPAQTHTPKTTYPQGVNNPNNPSTHPTNDPSNDPSNEGQRNPSSGGSNGGSPRTENIEPTPKNRGDTRARAHTTPNTGLESPPPPNFSSNGETAGVADATAGAGRWVGHPETVVDAGDARCRVHAGVSRLDVPPCGACGESRRLAVGWLKSAREGGVDARAAKIDTCTRCDEFGWEIGADGVSVVPARKCLHGELPGVDERDEALDRLLRAV